jgi:hypothetical protein
MKRALVILGLVLAASSADADLQVSSSMNGNQLLDRCEELEKSNADAVWCVAYVDGVWDTIHLFQSTGIGMVGLDVCGRPGTTGRQLALAVREYLRGNPKDLDTNAAPQVFVAFAEAFPCEKGNK